MYRLNIDLDGGVLADMSNEKSDTADSGSSGCYHPYMTCGSLRHKVSWGRILFTTYTGVVTLANVNVLVADLQTDHRLKGILDDHSTNGAC